MDIRDTGGVQASIGLTLPKRFDRSGSQTDNALSRRRTPTCSMLLIEATGVEGARLVSRGEWNDGSDLRRGSIDSSGADRRKWILA